MKEVLIIDQIGGNTGSLAKTFKRLKINVKYSSDSTDILHADHIVIPGVGHFANAMQRISDLNLIEPLQEAVIFKKIPVLGICLGMQLICRYSEEGNANGLGWIDAEVKHFNFNDSLNYKRPHIGWNTLNFLQKNHPFLKGIETTEYFYFVHSYFVHCHNPENCLAETEYEQRFASVIQKDNIFGVQFHPEKSYEAGDKLLMNFVNI